MKKIIFIPILVVILLGLCLAYLYDEYSVNGVDILTVGDELISLSVYDGPIELEVVTKNIGNMGTMKVMILIHTIG